MTAAEQRAAAKKFAAYWKDKGYEKGESQPFWLALLREVYCVAEPEKFISFEDQVMLDHTSFIDGYITETHVLIEQKGLGKDLKKGIKQSDGSVLSPFQQAKRYAAELPYSQRPRWIVTCNFAEFLIYDMEQPNGEPVQIMLDNLPNEYGKLDFLVNTKVEKIINEVEISKAAGNIVAELYKALLEQCENPNSSETLHDLNVLCVRLVFCFYAEDAGIMTGSNSFGTFLNKYKDEPSDVREMMLKAFDIFDTKYEDRDKYGKKEFLELPYVNGGLFDRNLKIDVPPFNEKIIDLIINKASFAFDWRNINPTIFGAVFESTLNPETRRSGGMHYTSIENIHKVIDPLFLDDLKAELEEIKAGKQANVRVTKLEAFREKLAGLKFLDPACGSGNFLTETYLSLRRLENEVLKILYGDQVVLDSGDIIKVSIGQFYGIEINDFACRVAQTALWIAEAQMFNETIEIVHRRDLNFLPLNPNPNIHKDNALSIDWETVVSKNELNYIMGNPPFVGHQMRNDVQVNDMQVAFYDLEKHGKLDYVCAWYNKAADYMKDTGITTAFVSTNSIIQGESVGILWKFLFENKKVEIQFAYQSFIWDSEADMKAHIHCVIIGFTTTKLNKEKLLYNGRTFLKAKHINGYLIDADDIYIQARGKCLTKGLTEMTKGSQPTDGGYLFLSEEEKDDLIKRYPVSVQFIKRFVGATEFINNKPRYCLWLKDVSPAIYKNIPPVVERLKKVAECRKNSPTESVRRDAEYPMLFTQIRQPNSNYLIMPRHSSENRRYIPLGYMDKDVICGDSNSMIPNASLYMFGVLESSVHMSWMRVVAGRLEMRYRYSPAVYNNFPWCDPTAEQKVKIEQTAQAILDARAKYPDCSLADLYDETTMPPELRRAHQDNDRAVLAAYGFSKNITESEIVAELMKMYQELTSK